MKSHSPNVSVQIVKNTRPVGKVFRKSNKNKQINQAESKLDHERKHHNKLNVNNTKDGKSDSKSSDSNGVLVGCENSSEISKKNNWKAQKSEESSLLKNKNSHRNENFRMNKAQKRKAEDLLDSAQPSSKAAKRTVENNSAKGNSVSAISNESEVAGTSGSKPHKRKRKKKKKKKPSDPNNETTNQYKPVLIVKEAKDISGNWKNLKDVIIQQDKAQAEKLKASKKTHEKEEQNSEKKSIPKETKKMKKKEKLELKAVIEEQKRQTEKYQESKQKHSVNDKEQSKKKKMDDIWFDNVDPILLGEEYNEVEDESSEVNDAQEKENVDEECNEGSSKAVAIDCEMVGIGIDGKESMLARVSVVNQYCRVIYNKYVKPQEPVVDYRTEFSGIRPGDIKDGHDFKEVQAEVAKILNGKILVGHGIDNDLRALFLDHPRSRIRDTARYKPFKKMFQGHTPKLKMLAKKILGVEIQTGEHDSVQDAQAVMRIYTIHKKEWDKMKKKVYQKPGKKTDNSSQ